MRSSSRSAPRCSAPQYGEVFQGDAQWSSLPVPQGDLYEWDDSSTYVKNPPYFPGMPAQPAPVSEIQGAPCAGRAR